MKKEKKTAGIKSNQAKSGGFEKNKGGRIGIFRTAEELQKAVDNFFKTEAIPTVAGLTLALGFCDKKSLWDYEHKNLSKFSPIIKEARLKIERFVERRLNSGENCTGAIFWLKNHSGYRDKTEEQTAPTAPIMIQVNFPQGSPPQIAIGGKTKA